MDHYYKSKPRVYIKSNETKPRVYVMYNVTKPKRKNQL